VRASVPWSVVGLARAERADLADFLAVLPPERWEAPTLCSEWSVRDVVAHIVSYEGVGPVGLARRFARGLDGGNALALAESGDRSPEQLLTRLRASLDPRGLTARFGGRVALVDGMIHHQDIRRALGTPRDIPAERLRVALPFARWAPPVGAWWRARGLRLVATDLGWSAGRGPEVRGPAEPVLMAIAGRSSVAAELTGPGVAVLLARSDGAGVVDRRG
jgi:uncharacterized protein (TIGR03083 family)